MKTMEPETMETETRKVEAPKGMAALIFVWVRILTAAFRRGDFGIMDHIWGTE